MKRFTIIALLLFVAAGIFGQQAVIQELIGTVELRKAGSAWESAVKGQTISGDTTISTGFKSTAHISLGSSLLIVRPLTRLTLKELTHKQETEKVELNVAAGRVRAQVKAPSGGRAEFTLQTPPATASVRGTIFELDVFSLWVIEGSVEYAGHSGAPVLIDSGGYSYINERTGWAVIPEETLFSVLKPELPIASALVGTLGKSAQGQNTFEVGTEIEYP